MVVLEILRAAKIVRAMQQAQAIEKGAVGLEGEMIDAPMLKQVCGDEQPSFGMLSPPSGRKDNSDSNGCWFGDT